MFESYTDLLQRHLDILLPITLGLFVLAVWLFFGRAIGVNRRIIATQRQRIVKLDQAIRKREEQIRKSQEQERMLVGRSNQLRASIAAEQERIARSEALKQDQYLQLYKKVTELAELSEQALISREQFTSLLAEFVRLHLGSVDIKAALESLKRLESRGFIDEAGYERISDLILERHYSGELGIKSQLKSVLKKMVSS